MLGQQPSLIRMPSALLLDSPMGYRVGSVA